MNFETMSKQRKMILIAAAIGVIAMFLPWWSLDMGFVKGSVNGMHSEGIVVFLCFSGAVALSVMGDQTRNLSSQNWMLALIAGALATLITLITFLNAPPLGDRGFGLYIALLAAAGVLFFAYTNRTAGDTLQSGFDSLKNSFGGQTSASANTSTTAGSNTKIINPTNDPTKPVV
jgi:uncharacterized protein YacL